MRRFLSSSHRGTGGVTARRLLQLQPQRALSSVSSGASSDLASPVLAGLPPAVLPAGVDTAVVESRVRFLEMLGVPDVAVALQKDPQLLSLDLPIVAAPRLKYLLEIGVDEIGPLVGSVPQFLSCDVTHDLHRRVTILNALGVKKISAWLQRNPSVLLMDVDAEMRPAVDFLRSVENLDVGKVLEKLPNGVFGKEEHLRERVRYLAEDLDVQPMGKLGRMISGWPDLLSYNIETMQPKVDWLKSIGIKHVGNCLYKNPRILSTHLGSLQAKHALITEEWGRSTEDIEYFPQAFTYSLTYLRSRAGFLVINGKRDRTGKDGKGGLHRILRTADYLFGTKMCERSAEEYQAFARSIALIEGGMGDKETKTLDEFAEEAASLMGGQMQEEKHAYAKYWERTLATKAREAAKQSRIDVARRKVQRALAGEGPEEEEDMPPITEVPSMADELAESPPPPPDEAEIVEGQAAEAEAAGSASSDGSAATPESPPESK